MVSLDEKNSEKLAGLLIFGGGDTLPRWEPPGMDYSGVYGGLQEREAKAAWPIHVQLVVLITANLGPNSRYTEHILFQILVCLLRTICA